jgi:hypothetical protein
MEDLFNALWPLLYDHGASARKEEGTRRYWATLSPEQQRYVYTTISTKLREDKFVQYDPIRAIKENLPKVKKQKQILSFDAYYDIYHTTEERDGWKMVKPEKAGDPPVHYVKIV